MRKKIPQEELDSKARRREQKKRPRMKLHGASLKRRGGHEAGRIIKHTKQ